MDNSDNTTHIVFLQIGLALTNWTVFTDHKRSLSSFRLFSGTGAVSNFCLADLVWVLLCLCFCLVLHHPCRAIFMDHQRSLSSFRLFCGTGAVSNFSHADLVPVVSWIGSPPAVDHLGCNFISSAPGILCCIALGHEHPAPVLACL